VPKIITGSWLVAKRVKMAERPQRNSKKHAKRLVKEKNGRVSQTGRILNENGGPEIFA